MAKPRIHGASASPFVRKVRVVLAEKGIDYDQTPVIPFNPPAEFKKISPLGKIPVYQEGDYTLPDSSCICAYLERVHPEPAMYPKDPKQYGKALFYEEYADSKMVEVMAPVFFQRVIVAKLMKGKPDETIVQDKLKNAIPPVFDWLETQVPDGDGIVGGRFSIADVALASPFVNFMHGGEKVDAKRWPKLAAYVERIHARPSYKASIEEEKAQFAAL
jgi:glutathione S-transferase